MISIARKNLSSLFWNPNNNSSNARFLLSIHPFSTSNVRSRLTTTPCPEFYDVLFHKHHFSPALATSLASSHLPKSTSPKSADSVLSFLKENGFTNAQLQKIVRYQPRILGFAIEGLEFRLKLFRDLGLSSEDIAEMASSNQSFLYSSTEKRIIRPLSILKGLLGSNDEVARLLRKSSWFISSDLDKTLMPNVDIFKSCGSPMERVLCFLFTSPTSFLMKPDVMRKSVDRAIDFGVPLTSVVFIQAVEVLARTSQGMWEVKLQTLRDLGFSDGEILTMFRRHPKVFSLSQNKLESAVGLLIGTGKYNISDIVANPASLGSSIEKRLEPRLQIVGLLESKNLIEKRPGLAVLQQYNDGRFFDKFVKPYFGEEYITKK